MDWARILAYVTGMVDQELLARNEYLVTETGVVGRSAAIEMMQQCIASPFLFLAVANYTRKNRRSLR